MSEMTPEQATCWHAEITAQAVALGVVQAPSYSEWSTWTQAAREVYVGAAREAHGLARDPERHHRLTVLDSALQRLRDERLGRSA